MADFGRFKLTNVGMDIEYKAQSGETLNFTKFVLGDGYYSGAIKSLTNLVSPIMNTNITRMNVQTLSTNKKISIGFNIDTSQIATGFYLREIGLFAEDPDTGDDVLVYYGNAGDTADYISSSTSTTISEKLIDLEIYISDVENITAVIDSSLAYASEQELQLLANRVSTAENKINTYIKSKTNFTINANDWVADTSYTNYNYKATIQNNIINSTDIVDLYFDSASRSIALDNGITLVDSYTRRYICV